MFLPGQSAVLRIGIDHQYPCAVRARAVAKLQDRVVFANPALLIQKAVMCASYRNLHFLCLIFK